MEEERRRGLLSGGGQAAYPEYTYSGNAEFIDDGDKNWRIKFLSGGTFTLLNSDFDVDIFLVGGGGSGSVGSNKEVYGGGGGGGGYTKTVRKIKVRKGINCTVAVGKGGAGGMSTFDGGKAGNPSSFTVGSNTYTANGAPAVGKTIKGGAGGSGGGEGGSDGNYSGFSGGSDGSRGGSPYSGTGQNSTTREFGETTGTLYAGGGGGGGISYGSNKGIGGAGGAGGGGAGGSGTSSSYAIITGSGGKDNTGGGGGGGGDYGSSAGAGGMGGSGIVIIRNAR